MSQDICHVEPMLALLGKVITVFVTWALVVLGWIVVSDQTQQREIAKNYLSALSELRKSLTRIEDAAISHHTTEYSQSAVHKILREISNLSTEISFLAKRRQVGEGASQYVVDFRRAVTEKNFDSSTYSIQSTDSNIVLNIEATKDSFDKLLLESADILTYRRRSLRDSISSLFRSVK